MSDKSTTKNRGLKIGLIIQSLAPLLLLTVIKNLKFDCSSCEIGRFISNNLCLLIVMMISLIWIIISIVVVICFKSYRSSGFTEGYTIKCVKNNSKAGLRFFLTLILPISIDELYLLRNAITFALILLALILLLAKTNLYFSNPVLILLGYRIIEFEFTEPQSQEYIGTQIGICPRGKSFDSEKIIKFKKISDNVLCIKQKRSKR